MDKHSLQYYLDRNALGQLSKEEWTTLRRLLQQPENQQLLADYLDQQLREAAEQGVYYPGVTNKVLSRVLQSIKERGSEAKTTQPVPLWRKWGWAAAVILLLGAGAYLYIANKNTGQKLAKNTPQAQTDIRPGSDRAQLTLSDGTTINLDSAATGILARQGSSSVVKLPTGEILYDLNGPAQGDRMINTMRTPKGGQYRLVLPDGTKAWLNAASSITYPAAFTGKSRKVNVTGEVYLEVAQKESRPFIVDVNGQSVIEVLGTRFNINSYADEGNIETTLLSGKIRVSSGSMAAAGRPGSTVVLKPGQQAIQPVGQTAVSGEEKQPGGDQSAPPVRIITGAELDLSQVLAWKNGYFSFNNTDLRIAARQLERWYDIQVKFQGKIPELKLKGKMDRGVQLPDVIRFLNNFGVKTRLEGKTLIIF